MKKLLLFLTLCLVLVSLVGAQSTYISPSAFAQTWGNGNCFPFGQLSYPYWRYQQIHSDLPVSVGIITGMAWRRQNTTAAHPAASYQMNFQISTAATTPTTTSSNFPSNHGLDLTPVMYGTTGPNSFQTVKWPATTAPASGIAPFQYRVTFNRPFVFKKKAICWEVKINGITSASTSNFYLDYNGRTASPYVARIKWSGKTLIPGLTTNFLPTAGSSCTASDQTSPAYMSQTNALSGGQWSINLGGHNLKKSSTAIYIIGSNITKWGAFTLPWMFPGSTNCGLYTNPIIISASGSTDTTGAIKAAPLTITDMPALAGLTIHTHWLCIDMVKALGVINSRGVSFTWPGPGGGTFPDTAAGNWNNQGLITEFQIK